MGIKKCMVNECDRKYFENGYCGKHYTQIRRYGKILERTILDKNEIVLYDTHAEIVLYNNKNIEVARAMIDLDDVDKVKDYKWYLSYYEYVVGKIDKSIIRLHRFLLNAEKDKIIDHEDRNKLNNRKSNLRICTRQENNQNVGISKNNTSGIIGVSWDKSRNKWVAQVRENKKIISLGRFENKEDAIKKRLEAELKYYGINFAPQRHLFEQYELVVDKIE